MLRKLPEASKDAKRELDLLIALTTVQLARRDMARRCRAAFAEAKQRCYELGDSERLMTVCWRMGVRAYRRSFDEVVRLGRSLNRAAKSSKDVADSLMGNRLSATACCSPDDSCKRGCT